jgi:hypothetical protein
MLVLKSGFHFKSAWLLSATKLTLQIFKKALYNQRINWQSSLRFVTHAE